MKKWLLFLLVAVSFATGTALYAQGQHWKGHGFPIPNLTADQKTKIEGIMGQTRQAVTAIRLEEKKKRIELSQAYLDPNVSRDTVDQKQQEIAALKAQKTQKMTDAQFAVRAILTPAQNQAFSQVLASRALREGHEGGHGCGMHEHGKHGNWHGEKSHTEGGVPQPQH